jgi:spore coat protein U-like protein
MKRRIAVFLMLGMLPWAGLNAQQTATTTFRVSAKVEEFCDVTAPDLVLGNYTWQASPPLLVTTAVRVTCTPNTTYFVGLKTGTSPARNAISGNTTGLVTVTGVGTGEPVDHTIFGGVPAAQVVPPGDFADAVSVRVHY